METLIGIQGKDFVILATDMLAARSILCYKHDEEKIAELDDRQFLACSGDQSSRVQFTEYIEKNLALLKLRSGRSLSNHAAANFIRNEIASALRSRGAYQVQSLFASFDDREGPALYYMDYLGTMQKVPYNAHGYGATFAVSQMDAAYSVDMSLEQGKKLIQQCCDQLALRFLINMPKFRLKIITEKGAVDEIYRPTFKEFSKE